MPRKSINQSPALKPNNRVSVAFGSNMPSSKFSGEEMCSLLEMRHEAQLAHHSRPAGPMDPSEWRIVAAGIRDGAGLVLTRTSPPSWATNDWETISPSVNCGVISASTLFIMVTARHVASRRPNAAAFHSIRTGATTSFMIFINFHGPRTP